MDQVTATQSIPGTSSPTSRIALTSAELVDRLSSGYFDGPHGTRVEGVSVLDSPLDLNDVDIGRRVRFRDCEFGQGIRLARARIGGLLIKDCTIGCTPQSTIAIESQELSVRGSIRVLNSTVAGSLDLRGARAEGSLIIVDSTFGGSPSADGHSIDATESNFGGSVELNRSVLRGGLAIPNAEIGGQLYVRSSDLGRPLSGHSLDARGVRVGAEFRVEGPTTTLSGSLVVTEARIARGFGIGGGARIGATYRGRSLSANGCAVGGTLWVEGPGTVLVGSVHLRSAELLGRLNLAEDARIGVDDDKISVKAHRIRVANEIRLRDGCVLEGGIELLDAHVRGPVLIEGRALIGQNVFGNSVYGPGLRANEMYVSNATLTGGLRLTGARFDGQLRISGSAIGAGSEGEALVLREASADVLRLDGLAATGSVDLRGAKVGLFDDRPNSWVDGGTGTIRTGGLVVQRLPDNDDFPLADRLSWLGTAESGGPAEAGVYRAFASAYSGRGDDHAATETLVDMRRRHSNRWTRALLAPISQGFRPQRALIWLIVVFLATWALTAAGDNAGWFVSPTQSRAAGGVGPSFIYSNTCDPNLESCMRPGLYALDVVLPIIDINATSAWQPEATELRSAPTILAWGLAASALLGWAFGGLFLFGVLNRVLEDTR